MINKKKNFANTASVQLTKGREELIKIWCFPLLWKCDMKHMIPARKNCTEEKKNKGKSLTMYMSKDIKIYRCKFQLLYFFFLTYHHLLPDLNKEYLISSLGIA